LTDLLQPVGRRASDFFPTTKDTQPRKCNYFLSPKICAHFFCRSQTLLSLIKYLVKSINFYNPKSMLLESS
jgi:hypothetical protein